MGNLSVKQRREFYTAALEGDFRLISKCLSKGFSPNTTNRVGSEERDTFAEVIGIPERARWNVLMASCLKGQHKTVALLLKGKADPMRSTHEGLTPLHIAAYKGSVHASEQLLKSKANVNQTEYNRGQTPLILAARGGHTQVAHLLIEHKANINVADSIDGMTALLWSIDGPLVLIECLLKASADVTLKNFYGQTPLLYAALASRHSAKAKEASNRAGDRPITTSGISDLTPSASATPSSIIKLLLDAKAQVNAKNYDEYSALMIAAHQGHSATVVTLIKQKADIEATARQGQTALMMAAAGGHSSVVQNLIKFKAFLDHTDEQGQSAVVKALINGNTSVVRTLLTAKADSNILDHDGLCPLAHCVSSQLISRHVIETILTHGHKLKINQTDHRFRSPLLFAAEALNLLACQRLLDRKASVSWTDDKGNSAVLLAVGQNPRELPLPTGAGFVPQEAGSSVLQDQYITRIASFPKEKFEQVLKNNRSSATPIEKDHKINDEKQELRRKSAIRRRVLHQEEIVRILFNSKADINAQNHDGQTALLLACTRGNGTLIRTLLQCKANPLMEDFMERRSALDVWKKREQEVSHDKTKEEFNEISILLASAAKLFGSYAQNSLEKVQKSAQVADPDLTQEPSPIPFHTQGTDRGQFSDTNPQMTPSGLEGKGPRTDTGSGGQSDWNPTHSTGVDQAVSQWSVEKVGQWLQAIGMGQYARSFAHGSVDGEMVLELVVRNTERLLEEELSVKNKLHRIKLAREMKKLSIHHQRKSIPSDGNSSATQQHQLTIEKTQADLKQGSIHVHRIPFSELDFLKEIGRGAFGVVYMATWRNSTVAIKRLHEQHMTDVRLNEFLSEARMMERVANHPRVVRFLGVCATQGQPLCIVTEYLPGGAVDKLLRCNRQLSSLLRMQWALDGASGVFHLHAERIIHRDIAARNLLVDKNLRAKVSDFGMSRTRGNYSSKSVEATRSNVGPVCWMAPEAIVKQQYSEKSDAYSFGVMLWELLTRKRPFYGETNLQVVIRAASLVKRLESKTPSPELNVSQLSPPQDAHPMAKKLLKTCLQTDPKLRPAFKVIIGELTKVVEELQAEDLSVNQSTAEVLQMPSLLPASSSAPTQTIHKTSSVAPQVVRASTEPVVQQENHEMSVSKEVDEPLENGYVDQKAWGPIQWADNGRED